MTTERFIVDDAGTLIDMQTRDTFDYVSDVCGLLNELHEENQDFKAFNKELAEELSVCANARISKDTRIERLEEKIQRERTSFTKTHERWSKEAEDKIEELSEENEQLRTKNNAYIQDIEVFKEENTKLRLENEELKEQMQTILELTKKIDDCTHDMKLIGDVE